MIPRAINPANLHLPPTACGANKLMVVVFVQDQDKHGVLAAKSFGLPQEEEEF